MSLAGRSGGAAGASSWGPGAAERQRDRDREEPSEEELEAVVETLPERLMGLTEMVPERAWQVAARLRSVSYWLVLRSAWVLGSSAALLLLPSFVELQRVELEEMQSAQKKQMMFGQGVTNPLPVARPA